MVKKLLENILQNKNVEDIAQHIEIANECFRREELRRVLRETFYYMIDMFYQIQNGDLHTATLCATIMMQQLLDAQHIQDCYIKNNFDFEKATERALYDARHGYNLSHGIKE